MKLGLFTPVFGKLKFDEMLAKVRSLGKIQALELGTGGWPGHDHLEVDALSSDPNWATTPWPPEFLEVLDWQWDKKAIPYWREAERFARDRGVKVALEAHPG